MQFRHIPSSHDEGKCNGNQWTSLKLTHCDRRLNWSTIIGNHIEIHVMCYAEIYSQRCGTCTVDLMHGRPWLAAIASCKKGQLNSVVHNYSSKTVQFACFSDRALSKCKKEHQLYSYRLLRCNTRPRNHSILIRSFWYITQPSKCGEQNKVNLLLLLLNLCKSLFGKDILLIPLSGAAIQTCPSIICWMCM